MANQIVVSAGAKVRNLSGVLTATSGVVSFLPIDVSLGIPQLDVNGKILVSQLPNSVMEYQGTWNAATNTPYLVNGVGNAGDVWLVSTGGVHDFGAGAITFVVSDQVIFSNVAEGSIWQKASGSNGTVTSVAVTESGDSLNITGSPIVNAGTINIGFNGTNLQYVNGAGNLTTFPILTGYVTAVSGTAPVVSSGGTTPAISMAAATGSVDGYLLATDFAIFNAKQSALTFSSPLVNTSGTISIPAATTSVNGYLASADFTTFNNKQNAITLTTTGTSGVATFVGATLNIPNYGSVLTGYVPYTGATQDVDLGAFKLNAQSLHIKGTAGNGHLGLKHQSASATASANEVSLFADSLGDLAWLNGNLYLSKFITSGNTAARSYTFPNANGTVALTSDLSAYVTLAGTQTITGAKTFSAYTTFTSTVDITSGLTFSNSGFTLVLQPPTLSVNRTVTLPNGTGTLALTSDLASYVPYTGATGSVNLGAYLLTASGVDSVGYTARGSGTLSGYLIIKQGTTYLGNVVGYNSINANARKYVFISDVDGTNYKSAIFELSSLTNNTDRTYTLPDASGTIALVGGSGVGTVTSVAALTIGTTGTDLSSSVATNTTTPVITLNVPTASATNRGALSSADWTTFNNKQSALTNPVTGTGTTNYLPKFTGASTIGNSQIFDNGTNVGIGTATPLVNLEVNGSIRSARSGAASQYLQIEGGDAVGQFITAVGAAKVLTIRNNSTTSSEVVFDQAVASSYNFKQAGTTKMTLDASGNLGLGVTPSAWDASFKALQIGVYAGLSDNSGGGGGYALFGNSYEYSVGAYKYLQNYYATLYRTYAGQHQWYNAPSGTAGAAITFTQAMTLNASGNLSIGTTVTNTKLNIDIPSSTTNGLSLIDGSTVPVVFTYSSVTGENKIGGLLSYVFPTFYSGGSERMRIWSSTGNVNIGTTPASDSGYKLDVNGTGRFSGNVKISLAAPALQLYSTTTSTGYNIYQYTDDKFYIGRAGGADLFTMTSTGAATFSSNLTLSASNGTLDVGGEGFIRGNGSAYKTHEFTTGASNVALYDQRNAAGTVINRLNAGGVSYITGGNVGIGTSSPSYKLDINLGSSYVRAYNNAEGFNFYALGNFSSGGQGGIYTGAGYVGMFSDGAYELSLGYNKARTMNFTSGGNVLIGTTTDATGKLQVNGTIYATGFYESSDIRFKNILETNPSVNVLGIDVIKFTRKDNDTNQVRYGYSAQQIQSILPDAVTGTDFLNVNYLDVHTLKIAQLEKEIKELKAK